MSLLLRSGPLLDSSMVVKVTQSSASSSYLSQLTFLSYGGGCLAVIDKFSISSVKPWDRPALGSASLKLSRYLILEGNRYLAVVEDIFVVALELLRRVPSVNSDGLILDKRLVNNVLWFILTVVRQHLRITDAMAQRARCI